MPRPTSSVPTYRPFSASLLPPRKEGKKNSFNTKNRMNSLMRINAHNVLPSVIDRNPSR